MNTFINIRYVVIAFLLSSTFLFVSCVSGDDYQSCPFTPYFEDRNLLYGEVLTITMVQPWHDSIRTRYLRAVDEFQRYMQDYNIRVMINFIVDETADIDIFTTQMNVNLMAGNTDTLISLTAAELPDGGIDWRNPQVSRFFADMWPVINADPLVNDENFNFNVFNALTLNDGSLRVLPHNIFTWHIMANLTIPGLADALAEHTYVTMDDLHRLHAVYAEHLGFYMYAGYDVIDVISTQASDFVDFANSTADFNNDRFIDMLTYAEGRINHRPITDFWGRSYANDCLSDITNTHAETFAFLTSIPFLKVHELLTIEEFVYPFGRPVPIANSSGELLISINSPKAISANASYAQQVLAWEFLKFMAHPDRTRHDQVFFYWGSGNHRFYRPFLQEAIYWNVARWYPQPAYAIEADSVLQSRVRGIRLRQTRLSLAESHDEALRIVMEYHDLVSNMPMTLRWPFQNAIVRAIDDNISSFELGLISAHEAATRIQNTVTLILLE